MSDAETFYAFFMYFSSMTSNMTDIFSSDPMAFVIHGKCHDNLSASSIPFYFPQKLGADATNARRKTSERGDVENCPIIRG